MVFVSLMTLSGCKEVPSFMPSYWDGLTKREAQEYIQNALQEKYGEEFVVKSMGIRSGQYYRELVADCSPKSDKDIVFRIEANHFSENRTLRDEYIRNVVRKQMKKNIDDILTRYYDIYAVEVNVLGLDPFYDSGIYLSNEKIIKAFSESFVRNDSEDSNKTNVWIVIKKSEQVDIDKLKNALQEMTFEFYSLNVYIDCFFGDQEIINICNEKANSLTTSHFEVMDITYDSDFRRERFVYHDNENGIVHISSTANNQEN